VQPRFTPVRRSPADVETNLQIGKEIATTRTRCADGRRDTNDEHGKGESDHNAPNRSDRCPALRLRCLHHHPRPYPSPPPSDVAEEQLRYRRPMKRNAMSIGVPAGTKIPL